MHVVMKSVACVLGVIVIVVAMLSEKNSPVRLLCAVWCGLCVVCISASFITSFYVNRFRMHLFASDPVNETLIVEARLCGRSTLFLVDTGYAGPPVISMSYLAVKEKICLNLNLRYTNIMNELEKGISNTEQHAAINRLIQENSCIAYTSGCTMRLMSIGDVQEQQADMLLCPPIMLRSMATGMYRAPKSRVVDADVLVSNPLPHSVHILTCDYLLHASPTMLDIGRGCISLRMNDGLTLIHRAGMKMYPVEMSGGAFIVEMRLGGEPFRVTVDTGAPGPVSLGKESAKRLTACTHTETALTQQGVNGERICSDIIVTTLEFGGRTVNNIPVFVNDRNVDGVDGYVGLGVLRAFNMLITHSGIGFSQNGLEMRSVDAYRSVSESRSCTSTGGNASCKRI